MKKKGRIGSSFDNFLKDEGIYAEVTAKAIKRVIVRQLDALMHDEGAHQIRPRQTYADQPGTT
ncbi:hypothetical protein [Bradyrhizobium iriomotense]|uniref:Uncharacterized protein n=1 Tax=Bradyrhizobium iriomotense TaxID=441950 RepID=A0ABQ6BC99_9BRAD|nr:hypothetical protein [Bradyrhizobium iriomotense]GLR89798.1 hypothetical protein GCM10007857_65120 [Bradyrhizobium iriomotense]